MLKIFFVLIAINILSSLPNCFLNLSYCIRILSFSCKKPSVEVSTVKFFICEAKATITNTTNNITLILLSNTKSEKCSNFFSTFVFQFIYYIPLI